MKAYPQYPGRYGCFITGCRRSCGQSGAGIVKVAESSPCASFVGVADGQRSDIFVQP